MSKAREVMRLDQTPDTPLGHPRLTSGTDTPGNRARAGHR